MSFWDKLKSFGKSAIVNNPQKNNNFNQLQMEKWNRNPNIDPSINPNATGHDIELESEDKPKSSKFMGMDFSKKDISRNKKGHYVSTATYPLPPCSHEKCEYEKNRRMRNANNKFL